MGGEPTCAGEACTDLGATRCVGDLKRERCTPISESCRVWSAVEPCSGSERCKGAGVCGEDHCNVGASRCISETQPEICEPTDIGFYQWSLADACEGGLICVDDGGCQIPPCEVEGSTVCIDPVTVARCERDEEALVWSDGLLCGDGLQCMGGVCGENECDVEGSTRCLEANDALYQVCGVDNQGFYVWSSPLACPGTSTCYLGACGQHECGPLGQKTCSSGSSVSACEIGDDGFLQWASALPCPDSGVCRGDGVCGQDACVLGESRCSGSIQEICGAVDGLFLAWKELKDCAPSGVCASGVCLEHECTSDGQMSCAGVNSFQVCGQQETGQMLLGEPSPCQDVSQLCKGEGICGTDACVLGKAECFDSTHWLECKADSNGFTEWSGPIPCGADETCLSGVCGNDACSLGDATCTDESTVGVCVLHPSGFTVWIEYPCDAGGMACLDGGICAFEGAFEFWGDAVIGAPSITARTDGSFAAVWTAPVFSSFQVKARWFSPNGTATTEALDAVPPVLANLPFPDIAEVPSSDASANLVIAWFNADGSKLQARWLGDSVADDGPIIDLLTTALSATPLVTVHSTPSGPRVLYVTATPGNAKLEYVGLPPYSSTPPTLIGESGGTILGYDCVDGTDVCVYAGTTSGLMLHTTAGQQSVSQPPAAWPSVAVAPSGSIFVTWAADEDGNSTNGSELLKGRMYYSDLSPVSEHQVISAVSNINAVRVVATATGFFTVFSAENAGTSRIYGQMLDSAGVPYGVPALLGDPATGPQADPRLALLADGRVLVAWRDGNGLGARIKGRFIDIW